MINFGQWTKNEERHKMAHVFFNTGTDQQIKVIKSIDRFDFWQ